MNKQYSVGIDRDGKPTITIKDYLTSEIPWNVLWGLLEVCGMSYYTPANESSDGRATTVYTCLIASNLPKAERVLSRALWTKVE